MGAARAAAIRAEPEPNPGGGASGCAQADAAVFLMRPFARFEIANCPTVGRTFGPAV